MNPDHHVKSFSDSTSFLKAIKEPFDLVTLDYNLPNTKADDLMAKVKAKRPELPMVIISGQKDIQVAVELLKAGAFDYLVKDDDLRDRLWVTMKNAGQIQRLQTEVAQLKEELKVKYDFGSMLVGKSAPIQRMFGMLEKACKTNITVSIHGETGTGKEVVAKAIHQNSDRKKKPFVAVNVAAIPENLLESELFGHEKGAFTGAVAHRTGKFEEARGGTLFLDEVAEMQPDMQAKILRVLQERELSPLGSITVKKLDIKLVVATHKNLAEEVEAGNFREDLYYRLLGVPIDVPPLRERGQDILLLAQHFIAKFCKENKIKTKVLDDKASEKLMGYGYPGNVQELVSIVELACLMSDGEVIEAAHLRFPKLKSTSQILSKEMTMREYEHEILKHYLDKYDNNVLEVAQRLDIGKSTVYRMMKEMELV